jgi:transposase
MKPTVFHPWSYQSAHSSRDDFQSDAVYWRHWANRLNLSSHARLRLEWMIFYFSIGKKNTTSTATHFGVSRRVFIKWKSRFNPNDLISLEDHSKAPKKKRRWTVTEKEEKTIISIRKSHMKWGKEKLKREYQRLYKGTISTNKIQKVINHHHLFSDSKTYLNRKKQVRNRKERVLITQFEKKPELGFLWHTDTIIIWWYGVRRVIFTALEEETKIAYARVYKTNSSKNAKDFLERLLYLSNHEVKHIHHDNGSEFFGDFEKACQELSLPQIFSRIRTPKDNPALER